MSLPRHVEGLAAGGAPHVYMFTRLLVYYLKETMNTEAIIEKLVLTRDEQILNTPLDELDFSKRIYRSLWRSRVRTVGDLAQIWSHILQVRNIGVHARREILGALQAWSLSIPNFTNPDNAEDQAENQGDILDCDLRQAVRTPIEALHLSQRTYRALKRNRIDTIADIDQGWDKIRSIRQVGTGTLDEIHKALEALLLLEKRPSVSDPNHGSRLAKNDRTDVTPADVVDYENPREIPVEAFGPSDRSIQQTKKHIITESGVVVSADLLQADEPRKSREERWKNVPPKPQDYAPKNIFQAIGEGQNKISSPIRTGPIRRMKKTLDGCIPENTEWLEMSLELLEKARTSRQVRTIECPICMAVTLSIRLKKHLVEMHPQAFRELQKAAHNSLGRQKEKGVSIVHVHPSRENHTVKCPLCEHTDRYSRLSAHIRDCHWEVDPGLVMSRFNKVHRSKDHENLSRYQDELNQLIKEYEWLKRGT